MLAPWRRRAIPGGDRPAEQRFIDLIPASMGVVPEPLPRPKEWRYPKLISEHSFDKLRLLDCTFAELDVALRTAEIIEDR